MNALVPHPYREAPVEIEKKPTRLETLRRWARKWILGDDGKIWCVVVEPSPFRTRESALHGPFTRRQARRFASQFVSAHPYGLAEWCAVKVWPPRMNRECPVYEHGAA